MLSIIAAPTARSTPPNTTTGCGRTVLSAPALRPGSKRAPSGSAWSAAPATPACYRCRTDFPGTYQFKNAEFADLCFAEGYGAIDDRRVPLPHCRPLRRPAWPLQVKSRKYGGLQKAGWGFRGPHRDAGRNSSPGSSLKDISRENYNAGLPLEKPRHARRPDRRDPQDDTVRAALMHRIVGSIVLRAIEADGRRQRASFVAVQTI